MLNGFCPYLHRFRVDLCHAPIRTQTVRSFKDLARQSCTGLSRTTSLVDFIGIVKYICTLDVAGPLVWRSGDLCRMGRGDRMGAGATAPRLVKSCCIWLRPGGRDGGFRGCNVLAILQIMLHPVASGYICGGGGTWDSAHMAVRSKTEGAENTLWVLIQR